MIPTDSGVQILTTISNRNAPTRYSYDVSLRPGQAFELLEGGGASVVNPDGSIELVAAPAWARDSQGREVPSHFEVGGNALVQVIDHASNSDLSYPIVADPIWLAPLVVKCLVKLGLSGPTIAKIASAGTPAAIFAAVGFAAVRCIFG